jgi:predicted RecA/RadA family phage recombinase
MPLRPPSYAVARGAYHQQESSMTTKQTQSGSKVNITTTGAVASGAVVKLSHTIGVAQKGAAGAGEVIPVAIDGIFELPKAAGRAWVLGEKLVWDVSAGAFDTTAVTLASGDVTGAAIAAAPAISGDTTGAVKLTPGNATLTP